MKYQILIVDDNEDNLLSTKVFLESCGYETDVATSGALALQMIEEKEYSIFILDFQMPSMNGAQLASRIWKKRPEAAIMMYSCDSSRDALKQSAAAGVRQFIEKNSDPNVLKEELELVCQNLNASNRLFRPILNKAKSAELLRSVGMIGQSDAMVEVVQQAINYRAFSKTVLIQGESGVGKELIAKAIHGKPLNTFFAVNCAAFAEGNLIESELFGYEAGAFTGAQKRKLGILEIAGDGTVFLDEVDKLSAAAQAALLRATREKTIRRVGSHQEIRIRCRIIAGGKNLDRLVNEGKYLPDLYYRLNFLSINIPPLRERKEDIGLLIDFFCKNHEEETGTKRMFRAQAIHAMEKYQWPGNVGELEGCVNKLLINATSSIIESSALDERFSLPEEARPLVTLADLEAKYEVDSKKMILSAIAVHGSQRKAANALKVSESGLRLRMSKLGLRTAIPVKNEAISSQA